jgi:hypothetical protein
LYFLQFLTYRIALNCIISNFFGFISIAFAGGAYILRSVRLVVLFSISQKKLEQMKTINTAKKGETLIYKNALQKYIIQAETRVMFTLVFIELALFFVLFSFNGFLQGCPGGESAGIGLFGLVHVLIYALALIVFGFLLFRVRDEYKIKNELFTIVIILLVIWTTAIPFNISNRGDIVVSLFFATPAFTNLATFCWTIYSYKKFAEKENAFASTSSFSQSEGDAKLLLNSVWQLIENPLSFDYFKQFCMQEFSIENLSFHLEIKNYFRPSMETALITSNEQEQLELSQHIFNKYFKHNSMYELNVSHSLLDIFAKRIEGKKFSTNMFQEAEEEIDQILRADMFHRFQRSPLCKKLLFDLSTKDIYENVL